MGHENHAISEVTRREIIDELSTGGTAWSGRLTEDEFLARLYDLDQLPSKDLRFQTAAQDIWKHRVVNSDWSDDWVFYDDRFSLLRAPDEVFLRFLCEIVHPVVRRDTAEAVRLVDQFNAPLRRDGWELYESRRMSEHPVFGARRIGTRATVFTEPTGWPKVDRQMAEARTRLGEAASEEQFQAVGLHCREVLISVAQVVYDGTRHLTLDGVAPSPTDAKRMLEAFVAAELPGGVNEEVRGHARAALKLAVALQHDRTADFRTAALCAEATASVVNLASIISGARAPRRI
jgi:hypothetical protein